MFWWDFLKSVLEGHFERSCLGLESCSFTSKTELSRDSCGR